MRSSPRGALAAPVPFCFSRGPPRPPLFTASSRIYLQVPALFPILSDSALPTKPLANPTPRLRHRALPALPPYLLPLRNHSSVLLIRHPHPVLTPFIRTIRRLGSPIRALASAPSSTIDLPLSVCVGYSRCRTRQDMRHRDDEEGYQQRGGEERAREAGARVEMGVRWHVR